MRTFLELKVDEGKINRITARRPGTAIGVQPRRSLIMSLSEMARSPERKSAGPDHHFRVIQAPYNLGMPEALTLNNQSFA